jgi:hypothetical protein
LDILERNLHGYWNAERAQKIFILPAFSYPRMGFDTPVKRNGKAPVLLGEKMMTSGEYHQELSGKARMNVINMNGKNKKNDFRRRNLSDSNATMTH